MRSLGRIWQTAIVEWGGAIRSRRALVLLVLYIASAVLCMNGTISVLGRMEKELATVFERYRYSFDPRELSGGVGLGLTAARAVTQLHQGSFLLESRASE